MRRILLLLVLASCSPGAPVGYPDDANVGGAQKKWCAALAATQGKSFQHAKECEAGIPTGSAAFVAKMAECFQSRMQELGESAPDMGAIVGECTELIIGGSEPGNVSKSPVVVARCSRSERCDEVEPSACVAAFNQLDGPQRATFTSIYNLRAQSKIAACIEDAPCGPEGENPCFKEAYGVRVWMPFSLGLDPSLAPK